MTTYHHTAVSKDWHIVRSQDGVFFGFNAEAAMAKAREHRRRQELESARRGGAFLPLTARQKRVARFEWLRECCIARALRRAC